MDLKLVVAGLLIGIWLMVLMLTPSTGFESNEPDLKISNVEDLVLKGVNVKVVFKDVDGILYSRNFEVKKKDGKIFIEGTHGTIVVGKLKSLEVSGMKISIEGEGDLESLIFDGVELKMEGDFRMRSLVVDGIRFVAENLKIEDAEKIAVKTTISEGEIYLKLSKVCEISVKGRGNLKITTNRKDLIRFVGGD